MTGPGPRRHGSQPEGLRVLSRRLEVYKREIEDLRGEIRSWRDRHALVLRSLKDLVMRRGIVTGESLHLTERQMTGLVMRTHTVVVSPPDARMREVGAETFLTVAIKSEDDTADLVGKIFVAMCEESLVERA